MRTLSMLVMGLAGLLLNGGSAQAGVIPIDATSQGWIYQDGTNNFDPLNSNYIVGNCSLISCSDVSEFGGEFRNYFKFSIPALTGTISNVELQLNNYRVKPAQAPSITYSVTSATNSPTFSSLGTGTQYGSRTYTPADDYLTQSITLNSSAINSILAVDGTSSFFNIGGRVTSPTDFDGAALDHLVFGRSGGGDKATLLITTEDPLPPIRPPQTLFLEFDAATAKFDGTLFDKSISKPDSRLTDVQKDHIVDEVNKIFESFNIIVTRTKPPATSDFSTVYIGVDVNELPGIDRLKYKDAFGVGRIDVFNVLRSDSAYVFTRAIEGLQAGFVSDYDYELAIVTIAHEAGHIMGLIHVDVNTELMAPTSESVSQRDISDKSLPISSSLFSYFHRVNNYRELGRNVGFADTTEDASGTTLYELLKGGFTFNFSDFLFSVYDAYLLIDYGADTLPGRVSLGDIDAGQVAQTYELLLGMGFPVALVGSSTPGGAIDIFGTANDLVSILVDELRFEDLFSIGQGLTFYKDTSNVFAPIGRASFMANSVPEPSTLMLLLAAGMVLLVRRRPVAL